MDTMNRAQRRAYNKKHKTAYTKEQFEAALLLARLNAGGEFDLEKLAATSKYLHMDNIELVPDGTEVKLNYDAIKSRPQGDLTDKFKEWVEVHKDQIFHITREGSKDSLVCLQEDDSEVRWLFDLYSDILVKNADQWVPPYELDTSLKEYQPADIVEQAVNNYEPESETQTDSLKNLE